jgi:hypothetical protein
MTDIVRYFSYLFKVMAYAQSRRRSHMNICAPFESVCSIMVETCHIPSIIEACANYFCNEYSNLLIPIVDPILLLGAILCLYGSVTNG